MSPLVLTPLSDIPLIRQGDSLADILVQALQTTAIQLQDDDILVLAQKIISKAEGRMVNLGTVTPSEKALELAPDYSLSAKDNQLIPSHRHLSS